MSEKLVSLLFNGSNSDYLFDKIQGVNNYNDIITEVFSIKDEQLYRKNKSSILKFHCENKTKYYNDDKKNKISYHWDLLASVFNKTDWDNYAKKYIDNSFFKKLEPFFLKQDLSNNILISYAINKFLSKEDDFGVEIAKFIDYLDSKNVKNQDFNHLQINQISSCKFKKEVFKIFDKYDLTPLINQDTFNNFFLSYDLYNRYDYETKVSNDLFNYFNIFFLKLDNNQKTDFLKFFSNCSELDVFKKSIKNSKEWTEFSFLYQFFVGAAINLPKSKQIIFYQSCIPFFQENLGDKFLDKINFFLKNIKPNNHIKIEDFKMISQFYEKNLLEQSIEVNNQKNKSNKNKI